ncbi:MAG: sigma-54-dependent transcriptional regulator [Thermoanaerobaculia bacterium]
MAAESRGARLLVVEDKESLRRMLVEALTGEGYRITAEADGEAACRRLAGGEGFDLVLTDLKLPGCDGLEVLRVARAQPPPPPVVVLTAYGTVRTAVEAMRRGACDFLEKPIELAALFELVAGAVASEPVPPAFEAPGAPAIIGRHPRLRTALTLLRKVAPTDSTVLLTGESGTGKELFARALHALSPRARRPFVAVNCAAIPEALIESELFGHEKGAFTGADRRRAGRFELANRGTLLLDEIGDLPLPVQAKVLRVLETRAFERVGGERTLTVDVRIVAATNRDLRGMVVAGRFRSDLYYRLEIFPIDLPPLRERPQDVPLLARHLAARIAAAHGVDAIRFDAGAEEWLAAQGWPGNVRELSNLLERATIVAPGDRWTDVALAGLIVEGPGRSVDEETAIRDALRATDGDKLAAAERLGVSYRTLQRRLHEYDLEGYPKYRD